MELFSITCSTCRAQLNVHSEDVIGQIHACPRCGSMVLVKRPEGDSPPGHQGHEPETMGEARQRWAAGSLVASTTPAIVEGTFEDAARMVEESPKAELFQLNALSDVVATEATPVELGASSENCDEPPNVQDTGHAARRGAIGESTDKTLPDAAWASPAEHVWRGWAIYGTAVLAGVVGTVVICNVLISWFVPVQQDEGVDQAVDVVVSPTAESSTRLAATADPAVVEPWEKMDSTRAMDDAERQPNAASLPAANANGDAVATHVTRDKLSNAYLATALNQGRDGDLSAQSIQDDGEPRHSNDFEIDKTPTDVLAAAVHELSPTHPRQTPHRIDIDARLADQIPEIEFPNVPLMKCLRFVSDFSTIPISIRPEALLFARRSPGSRIELRKQNSTVEEIVKEILDSLKLMYIIRDDQLIVTNKAPDSLGLKEVTYRLHDLVGQEPTASQEWAELIRRLIAPNSWRKNGGTASITNQEGSLVVRQTGPRQWEVLELCEKLRVARGLSPKSGYRRDRFELTTRTQRARHKLSQPVKLNFRQPTRLVDILDRLGQETQSFVLVDWINLRDAGWSADVTATLRAQNVPLKKAIVDLLAPLGLAYRVVDATVLQVSTRDALQERYEVEFYRVVELLQNGMADAQLMARIREVLGSQIFHADLGVLHLDVPSQCLIARLSQHDHQRLSAQLAEWQSN